MLDALPQGARVAEVRVDGARSVPPSIILAAIATRRGAALDRATLEADLQRIAMLSTFDRVGFDVADAFAANAREPRGVVLTMRVHERPVIGVVYEAPGTPRVDAGQWVRPLAGDLYDGLGMARALAALETSWRARGYGDARAEAHALHVDDERVDVCVDLDPGPLWTVDRIEVVGTRTVPAGAMLARVDTKGDAFNEPGKPYRADLLRADVARMKADLRDRGLVDAIIGTPRLTWIRERSAVRVEIPVYEGSAPAPKRTKTLLGPSPIILGGK
jgi:outer membrane protein assembly factor BamA